MRTRTVIAIAGLTLFGLASNANANPYVVTIQQVGADVVATGGGNINTTGLTGPASGFLNNPLINPFAGELSIGAGGSAVPISLYTGFSGPTSFGTANIGLGANSATGPEVFMWASAHELFLPTGYVSDSAVGTSTATFAGTTLAALGLTSGASFEWTWGAGTGDQTFTIQIGTPVSAVPLPAALPLFATGLGALGLLGWRRKKKLAA